MLMRTKGAFPFGRGVVRGIIACIRERGAQETFGTCAKPIRKIGGKETGGEDVAR